MHRSLTLAVAFVAAAGVSSHAAAQDTRVVEAARQADTAGVRALVEAGADPNTAQADGATALHWAAHWDDLPMAEALIAAGADAGGVNDLGATPLWLASQNGGAAMVEALLAAGADANRSLPAGETPLMTAARTGNPEAVRLLIDHGAAVDAREETRGQTALMWAIGQGHGDVVRVLLDAGADIHLRSTPRPRRMHSRTAGFDPVGVFDSVDGGNTALLFAARHGDLGVARRLVAAGADVNDTAPMGTSALVIAAMSGHADVAAYLLDQGADPNAADPGYTALHATALRGLPTLTTALLDRGADPDAPVVTGSPGRRNSPDYVLEHDVVGASPLWLAAHFSEPEVMAAIAAAGADPGFAMPDGATPLMAAVAARRRTEPGLTPDPAKNEQRILACVTVAIEAGVDVTATDAAGDTALHTAARRRLDSVVRVLVEAGTDPDTPNAEGQTPLALAAGRGGEDTPTQTLLRELGALRNP